MYLSTSPTSATATVTPSPTIHRDNWRQRRYTFLSKTSMFGGELKDELVEQNDGPIDQETR